MDSKTKINKFPEYDDYDMDAVGVSHESFNDEDDEDERDEGFDVLENENSGLNSVTNNRTDMSASIMKEIVEMLNNNSDISCSSALELNKQMQRKLVNVRDTIVQLLEKIKNRISSNQKSLSVTMKYKAKGVGIRGAYLKGGTFYFKGNMFFKDVHCRSCPNNADYTRRSEVEGEMFPMDFELRGRHVWSMTDKYDIVQGIKEQVIEHLNLVTYKPKKRKNDLEKKIALHTEKLANLLEKVDNSFEIDWNIISKINLKHRHSPSSSKAMWNVYLKPEIKRGAWSNEENKKLVDAAKKHNFEDWRAIASEVGYRSDYQCFVHFQTKLYMLIKRERKWTEAEDKRLLEYVNICTVNGVINWNAVSARFPHRSKARISVRYYYTVNPVLSHAPFTPEEDLMLLAAIEEYGENFACMPRTLFPNRSTLQLRNRYRNTLCNRDKNNGWTREEDKKLVDFVAEHGNSNWSKCAQMLGTHTRTSCRGRYYTIQKFLKKHPNAKIEDLQSRPRPKDNCITTENWTEKLIELRNNPDACKVPHKTKNEKHKRDRRRKMRPKKNYVKKLRANERDLYNFFKYGYNFKLASDPCRTTFTRPFSLAIVQNACGFKIPPYEKFRPDETLPYNVRESYSEMLAWASAEYGNNPRMNNLLGYRISPNWATLMGFRALCVQSNQVTSAEVNSKEVTVIENSQAVQLFRERLRVILHTTALLSRLNPQNINNLENRFESLKIQETFSQKQLADEPTALESTIYEECQYEQEDTISSLIDMNNEITKRRMEQNFSYDGEPKRLKIAEVHAQQYFNPMKQVQIKKELE